MNICLMNDSFPPYIDGVANTVKNYADIINNGLGKASVITPFSPCSEDEKYPYPIVRYPSSGITSKAVGYRAGIPFSNELMDRIEKSDFDIIHCHCPVSSLLFARPIRDRIQKPLILTYHTKFDIDIANAIKGKLIRKEALNLLVKNISACDEVWCVSKGAGDNLRSIGYEGDVVVMENGVDFPRGRVSDDEIRKATDNAKIPGGVKTFLFVGRMMWYKGIRIILDALEKVHEKGLDFRMVFIGGGTDKNEIIKYADGLSSRRKIIFCEPVYDREILRAWYCRADMFLFPSTFDTNGLVVREAAACSLGSVLIKNSCASEGVTDGQSGLLIDENDEAMARCIERVITEDFLCEKIGKGASEHLYISWQQSVENAFKRYETVSEAYKNGLYTKKRPFVPDDLYNVAGSMTDTGFNLSRMLVKGVNDVKKEISELVKFFEEYR